MTLDTLVLKLSTATGADVEWKVYLAGEAPDFSSLGRHLPGPATLVGSDEQGWFLQSEEFEALEDADQVRLAALQLIPRLNGIAAIEIGGYRPVTFADRVVRANSAFVFAEAHMRGTGELTVSVMRAGGSAEHIDQAQSSMTRRLDTIKSDVVLDEVYRVIGSATKPGWFEVYKAFEILRKAAGGEAGLERRTGVAKQRFKLLTLNSNHPDLHGDSSRHAVPEHGRPPRPGDKITLDEGLGILGELIEGYLKSTNT